MKKNKINIFNDPKSFMGEAYRTIRTNIEFSSIDRSIKSIVITSSIAQEGKTTTAVNLAYSTSQSDKRVLLIDCDLRKPSVHKALQLPNSPGLTTVLAECLDYHKYVHTINEERLDILTSGPIPPNPVELLGSKRMRLLLEKTREEYDMVIMDSPPAGILTDAVVLSTVADGTILVCSAGKTEISAIKATKSALNKVNANIIGVVMNKTTMKKRSKYYYY